MKKYLLFLLMPFLVFATTLEEYATEDFWLKRNERYPRVTREALENAIENGRTYFLNHQKGDGNFIYSLDLSNGRIKNKDNPIRQAGALWAVCSLCRDRYNEPTGEMARRGIEFFAKNMITLPNGLKCTAYPEKDTIATGTVALYCLALIEYLRAQEKFMEPDMRIHYQGLLDTHLAFLKNLEMEDGSWIAYTDIKQNVQGIRSSPYYDGEALLAYIKAAKYLGRTDLIPRIEMALPKLVKKYTEDCWADIEKWKDSKGFSQWGMMSMGEYFTADWNTHDAYILKAAPAYAWWLIHGNKLEERTGNTGYSVEGLLGVYSIFDANGDKENAAKIRAITERIMARLLTLQCGSELSKYNSALSKIIKFPENAEGGIIAADDDPTVRIDTHQHQMHAMLLMLKLF